MVCKSRLGGNNRAILRSRVIHYYYRVMSLLFILCMVPLSFCKRCPSNASANTPVAFKSLINRHNLSKFLIFPCVAYISFHVHHSFHPNVYKTQIDSINNIFSLVLSRVLAMFYLLDILLNHRIAVNIILGLLLSITIVCNVIKLYIDCLTLLVTF